MISDSIHILDKGCYWIICIPVPPDDIGWKWHGWIWVKGKSHPLTHMFKRTIPEIEMDTAIFMRCEEK